jgi:Haem-binding domain
MNRGGLKWVVGGVAVLILIQFIPVRRTNPPVVASRSLEAHVDVPIPVRIVLQRSCYNCHSSATLWPWYSHVAPISWYVVHDVNTGRSHINFQDWAAQVNAQEGNEHLGLICKLIRDGSMPPAAYRVMHQDAYVSPEEANTVCAWSQKFADANESDKKAD